MYADLGKHGVVAPPLLPKFELESVFLTEYLNKCGTLTAPRSRPAAYPSQQDSTARPNARLPVIDSVTSPRKQRHKFWVCAHS